MEELSKYVRSESVVVMRSKLKMAEYNPREITEEAKKTLKRGIKKYGLVGGIVVNRRTGWTIVSGHQRVAVMDDLNKYPENDYALRVDVIDVDAKQEKELNILMNNPNAQGQWNYVFHTHNSFTEVSPRKTAVVGLTQNSHGFGVTDGTFHYLYKE